MIAKFNLKCNFRVETMLVIRLLLMAPNSIFTCCPAESSMKRQFPLSVNIFRSNFAFQASCHTIYICLFYFLSTFRKRCGSTFAWAIWRVGKKWEKRLTQLGTSFDCIGSGTFGVRFSSASGWFAGSRKGKQRQIIGHNKKRHRPNICQQSKSYGHSCWRFTRWLRSICWKVCCLCVCFGIEFVCFVLLFAIVLAPRTKQKKKNYWF